MATSTVQTTDTFITAIPTGPDRVIAVHRRRHGEREYVRLRVWHKHRTIRKWYPDRHRSFVVTQEFAQDLADGIAAAAAGEPIMEKPMWLFD